jgi:acyl carrier protein
MNKAHFFTELHSALEIKSIQSFDENTSLKGLEEYDSMMILGIIAFVDQFFDKTLTAEQLNGISDVTSLMELIGIDNFE